MALAKMEKGNGDFYCGSCTKNLIDFQGKTYDEIKAKSTPDTCGIFDDNQVKPHTNFGFFRRSTFRMLTVFSLIGFNVAPMAASAYSETSSHATEIMKGEGDKKTKKEKKKRKKHWNPFRKKRRKGEYPIIGCPSF